LFNKIDTNNVDSKSRSCAYSITTKKHGILWHEPLFLH